MADAGGPSSGRRVVHRAGWVLPISQPPIENGWVEVEDGLIVAVGATHGAPSTEHESRQHQAPSTEPESTQHRAPSTEHESTQHRALSTEHESTRHRAPSTEHESTRHRAPSTQHVTAILPALVNAHTHLELSWMRGQVPPAASMPQWVDRLMALRRTVGREPPEPIADAIREARATGTTLVGDITNTFAAYEPLADSEMWAAVFRELLGFNAADPDALVKQTREAIDALRPAARLRPSIVAHAPYSVSPALLRAIASASRAARTSIHLGESAEEIEFLRTGTGPWRDLLTRLGVWSGSWTPPSTGPVDYIAAHGLLNERLVAVHCVQLTDGELAKLAAAGATVVTCPRSNRWVGAGDPPIERFYASGVRVAVGTDSLASVDDLNLFSELREMRRLAPSVPAGEILASATRHGADALGFGTELGTIEPGKRAELISVTVPHDVRDVEEYLVNGIRADQVTWLRETARTPNPQS